VEAAGRVAHAGRACRDPQAVTVEDPRAGTFELVCERGSPIHAYALPAPHLEIGATACLTAPYKMDRGSRYAGLVSLFQNSSSSSTTTSSSLLRSLAELASALAAASDEPAILAAAMTLLQRWGPHAAMLVLVEDEAGGRPGAPSVVARWGVETPDVDILPALAWVDAGAPLALDVSGVGARMVLPLTTASSGGWQGALVLAWPGTHDVADEERDVYRVMMPVLGGHIGGLRLRRDALAEVHLLHALTHQLHQAKTLEELLVTLRQPAPAPKEAEVILCSIENDDAGKPKWLTAISTVPVEGRPSSVQNGARYHLPEIPFSRLYLSSPDEPLLIDDVQSDPRVDEHARSLYNFTGARATIVIALTLQGRWVGLLNLTWARPMKFGERDQRIYHALAKHAALLLDNTEMLVKLRRSQAETHHGRVLKAVLDNVPAGILYLDVPSGAPRLVNPAAERLVGRTLDGQLVYSNETRQVAAQDQPGFRAITTGEPQSAELDVLRDGKERVHLDVSAVPVLDELGAVCNVVVVLTDITSRRQADADRARLQDEVIRVQAAALAERSSPLIPITDEILVLPIIGSLDAERGTHVLATVLDGSRQRSARVTIIDITGVRTFDTQAASVLIAAAKALQLLGVEPVLSGIQPQVAQALVTLDIRFDGVVTRGTLQSAIQYAQERLGRRWMGSRIRTS